MSVLVATSPVVLPGALPEEDENLYAKYASALEQPSFDLIACAVRLRRLTLALPSRRFWQPKQCSLIHPQLEPTALDLRLLYDSDGGFHTIKSIIGRPPLAVPAGSSVGYTCGKAWPRVPSTTPVPLSPRPLTGKVARMNDSYRGGCDQSGRELTTNASYVPCPPLRRYSRVWLPLLARFVHAPKFVTRLRTTLACISSIPTSATLKRSPETKPRTNKLWVLSVGASLPLIGWTA
eukprot:8069897-Pyramimonas_sp.AAC.1